MGFLRKEKLSLRYVSEAFYGKNHIMMVEQIENTIKKCEIEIKDPYSLDEIIIFDIFIMTICIEGPFFKYNKQEIGKIIIDDVISHIIDKEKRKRNLNDIEIEKFVELLNLRIFQYTELFKNLYKDSDTELNTNKLLKLGREIANNIMSGNSTPRLDFVIVGLFTYDYKSKYKFIREILKKCEIVND